MILTKFLPTQKIREIKKKYKKYSKFTILDIGCANNSPSLIKYFFPNCIYHAIDIDFTHLSDESASLIDKKILIKPTTNLSKLINQKYDVILLSHVLEHMKNPYKRLAELLKYLGTNSLIYISFPSLNSFSLPFAFNGTLHFHDDKTHIYIPTLSEVVNILLKNNLRIIYGGYGKDSIRYFLGFFLYVLQFPILKVTGKLFSKGMWYFLKFETVIVATNEKR